MMYINAVWVVHIFLYKVKELCVSEGIGASWTLDRDMGVHLGGRDPE